MQPDLIYFFPFASRASFAFKNIHFFKEKQLCLGQGLLQSSEKARSLQIQCEWRFSVTPGHLTLSVASCGRLDFALGCLKTFHLSSKIKIIIWDAFWIKGETSIRSQIQTAVVDVSALTGSRVSVFFCFVFFATGNFRKDKRQKKTHLYQDAQTTIFSPAVTTEIWK